MVLRPIASSIGGSAVWSSSPEAGIPFLLTVLKLRSRPRRSELAPRISIYLPLDPSFIRGVVDGCIISAPGKFLYIFDVSLSSGWNFGPFTIYPVSVSLTLSCAFFQWQRDLCLLPDPCPYIELDTRLHIYHNFFGCFVNSIPGRRTPLYQIVHKLRIYFRPALSIKFRFFPFLAIAFWKYCADCQYSYFLLLYTYSRFPRDV